MMPVTLKPLGTEDDHVGGFDPKLQNSPPPLDLGAILGCRGVEPYEKHSSAKIKIKGVVQTDNGCGTASLAAVMSHWGVPTTQAQVDEQIRPFDLFTAPDNIVLYARSHGMNAEQKNNSSLDDLAKLIDQGVPPLALIDPSGDRDMTLHYVTVKGYERDQKGKIAVVTYVDPSSGRDVSVSAAKFQKMWGHLKLAGVDTGFNNVLLSIAPKNQKLVGTDGKTRNTDDIQLPHSDFGGLLQGVFANVVANTVTGVAKFFEDVGKTATNVANGIADFFKSIFG